MRIALYMTLSITLCTFALSAQSAAEKTPLSKEAKEAAFIYKTRCVLCHGIDGSGKGPAAATLKDRPKDFRDAKWQKAITDAQIKKIILRGGAGAGKSPLMPPNPDLLRKEKTVDALRKIVRSFDRSKKTKEKAPSK